VAAFLTRTYKKGSTQAESYKGRDVFDVIWMLGEIKKMGLKVDMPDKRGLTRKLIAKADRIEAKELYNDLQGFFADLNFVSDFCDHFKELFETNLRYL
jgi:hypothetical protein